MHFLLLGASGRTGQLVITEALRRGHTITALVRKADSLTTSHEGLTIVQGSPLNEEDVERAFNASGPSLTPSAAIMTLASVRETDSPFAKPASPPRMLADSGKSLATVLKRHGVTKIVVLSAVGVGDSWARLPMLTKALMSHSNMKYSYEDHNLLDEELRASGMDFVLVRPTRLDATEIVKPIKDLGAEGKGQGMLSSITRASVAKFLVDVTEVKDWDGKAVVITNC